MTPFDIINAINYSKENLFEDPLAAKDYVPFIVNRGLSYFHDTVFYANEMNRSLFLDKDMQFAFLLNSISKKKRFSKWSKKDPSPDAVKSVMEYYGYSERRAMEALALLTESQLSHIKEQLNKGGR